MDFKRCLFLLTGTLGLLRCGLSVGPGNWLTESGSPYTFENAGKTSFVFPSADYKEWSIFNASSTASEAGNTYYVSQEGDEEGPGMLRFNDANILDEQAWLALGITSAAADTVLTPLSLIPEPGKLRMDTFSFKLQFAYSDAVPEMDDLLQMYASYAGRQPADGALPLFAAAKLGICVLQDGNFYLSRVKSQKGTGTADDLTFEFCNTGVPYSTFNEGPVTIRIEFRTYLGTDPDDISVRAYRVFASAEGIDEVCLSKGLGYKWLITDTSGYTFDFKSFEADDEASWLYAIDNAYALQVALQINPEAGYVPNFDFDGLHTVKQVAFNATEGGFYSAWMAVNRPVDDKASLTGYQVGEFASYLKSPGAAFDTYATWASANSVILSEHLDTDSDTSGTAFNAFLLNTSPEALAGTTPALSVTGIVTDKDANTVTVTVRGPEGCDITDLPAARLCIRRAATLGEVATAEAQYYDVSPTAQQTLTVVLPYADEDGTEYPFLKACLVPIAQ